jgi:hypothetical protein
VQIYCNGSACIFALLSDFQDSSETIDETKGMCNNKKYTKQRYKNIVELCEL